VIEDKVLFDKLLTRVSGFEHTGLNMVMATDHLEAVLVILIIALPLSI
jgi:hypothetical protein